MVKYTIQEIHKLMHKTENIRNITVIAHVDHGKSTLSDCLIARAGLMDSNSERGCHLDN